MSERHTTSEALAAEKKREGRKGFVFLSVLLGLGLYLGASTFNAVVAQINMRTNATFPWFVVPVALLSLWMTFFCTRFYRPDTSRVRISGKHVVLAIVGIILLLAALGIVLTGWRSVTGGVAALPGDAKAGSDLFKVTFSLTILATAGLIEEAAIRSTQLRIQAVVPVGWAEGISGTLFLVLHFARLSNPYQAVFLCVQTIMLGRLTTWTQSLTPSALAHALANLTIALFVLYWRP